MTSVTEDNINHAYKSNGILFLLRHVGKFPVGSFAVARKFYTDHLIDDLAGPSAVFAFARVFQFDEKGLEQSGADRCGRAFKCMGEGCERAEIR